MGLIVSALRKLGSERAVRMLAAFDVHRLSFGWEDCPLALAYGPPNALLNDHGFDDSTFSVFLPDEDADDTIRNITPDTVAQVLGLTETEVGALTRAFDGAKGSDVSRYELHCLVAREAMRMEAVLV